MTIWAIRRIVRTSIPEWASRRIRRSSTRRAPTSVPEDRTPLRIAWHRHSDALYGNSLKLNYAGLDPAARYRVRFMQPGEAATRATRLVANGKWEIHPMQKGVAMKPVEFDIPAEATAGGKLTLEWQANPEEAGNGRFVQVCEVWLLRQKSE